MKISRSIIYPTLTGFSVLPFLPLLQLLECLSQYMCGHNFTMKFASDFHNYTELNGLLNSFSWFTIAPPNKWFSAARLQTSMICKNKKKKKECEKWLLGGVLQMNFTKNYTKFTEKYLCEGLFLILLKVSGPSGLQLY